MKAFFMMFMCCINFAYADVYKCAGDDGGIKFSDHPCNGASKKTNNLDTKVENTEVKKYPGYNQEKYLALSQEKRNALCALKKKAYEDTISNKCLTVVSSDSRDKKCLSGSALDDVIGHAKRDYEFACQI